MNWRAVELAGDPLLIVGLRDRKRRLHGRRVNIEGDVHDALRDVAETALSLVQRMDHVPYTPYVDPEEGEYLALDTATLTQKLAAHKDADPDDAPTSIAAETASLVQLVSGADYHESVGAGSLGDIPAESFYATAICFRNGEERIGFVTRTNPRQVLKRSLIPLGKSEQGDRLKKVSAPELVLEPDVDVIISSSEVAILNRTQFQFLVSDSTLIALHVPAQVQLIDEAFAARGVQVSLETREALRDAALRSPRIAKRLDVFAERVAAIDAEALTSGAGFTAQELEPEDFMKNGVIQCSAERIPVLLDALEGRFFADAFSPERRRADRFRKR